MPQASEQVFRVSMEHLMKRAGSVIEARRAFDRANAILGAGGRPVCFHSEFGGYTVLDENDSSPNTIQRILSLERSARPSRW